MTRQEYDSLIFKYIPKPEFPENATEQEINLLVEQLMFMEKEARKTQLTLRWQALGGKRYEVYKYFNIEHVPNPDAEIFPTYILESENGEELLAQFEQKKQELDAQEDAEKNHYSVKRREAYIAAGLTIDKLIIDLWEAVIENRSDAANATQAIRQQIKQLYPKT